MRRPPSTQPQSSMGLSKNTAGVLLMSSGFFFLFMAFNTAQNLETTIVSGNPRLVYASQASLYATFTLTAIFAPRIVSMLGTKLSMAIGAIPYVLLVFANIQNPATYELFIPVFLAVGLGAAILWTAQGISLSRFAVAEAARTKEPVDIVTSRYNGYFWTGFQFNGALGLTIASSVFVAVDNYKDILTYFFVAFGIVCGFGLLILFIAPAAPSVSDIQASEQQLLATATASSDTEHRKGHGPPEVSLYQTAKLFWSSRRMQLLIPIIFFTGASLGFNSSTFPLVYQDIDKTGEGGEKTIQLLDSSYVGFISALFFLGNSICSFAWGKLIPRFGRRWLFVVTLVMELIYFGIVIMFAKGGTSLQHNGGWTFVAVGATSLVFAVGDSVLESQLPAIIQSPSFFPDEVDRDAANSNIRLWQPLGFTAQFVVGIIWPGNVLVQAALLIPLLVLSVAILFVLDRYVHSIEATDKQGYKTVPTIDAEQQH